MCQTLCGGKYPPPSYGEAATRNDDQDDPLAAELAAAADDPLAEAYTRSLFSST